MQDIMCKLKEVETTEVGDSSSQIEEVRGYHSFLIKKLLLLFYHKSMVHFIFK